MPDEELRHRTRLARTAAAGELAAKLGRHRSVLIRAACGAATVLLGFWGFVEVYRPANPTQIAECVFKTLQLLVAQFPSDLGDAARRGLPLPLALQFARFTMPAFFAWIGASALIGQLRQPAGLLGLARLDGHVIITGDNPLSVMLVRLARADGRRRVFITASPDSDAAQAAAAHGATMMVGKAGDPDTWRLAGLARAQAAYLVDDDDGAVTLSALSAVEAAADRGADRPPISIFCAVEHEDLGVLMETTSARADTRRHASLRVASLARMSARVLNQTRPLYRSVDVAAGEPVRALIIGFGSVGEQIALQILRTGMVAGDAPPEITVVDPDADQRSRAFQARYGDPDVLRSVKFVAQRADKSDPAALAQLLAQSGPRRANVMFITAGEDADAYLLAVAIRRVFAQQDRFAPPIYVRQRGGHDLTSHATASEDVVVDMTRIHGFGQLGELAREFHDGRRLDRRAEAIHELYASRAADREIPPWKDLNEKLRQSSRDQADYLAMRLATLGLRATPGAPAELRLAPATHRRAAQTEHLRWSASAQLMGWRHGEGRDDDRLLHPSLVAFDQLPAAEQAKDRAVVSETTDILAREGQAAAPLVRIETPRPGDPDDGALKARLAAALRSAEGLPVLVTGLEDKGVCRLVYELAHEASAPVLVRVETATDIPTLLRRLPDAETRRMARWLINHADQVLPTTTARRAGRSAPSRPRRASPTVGRPVAT